MRISSLIVLTLFGMSIAPQVRAEVITTLQFFGPLSAPDQTFSTVGGQATNDSRTRDDSTARANAAASVDLRTGELGAKAGGEKFVSGETDIVARAVARALDTLTINGPATEAIPVIFQMAVDGRLIIPDSAFGPGRAFAAVEAEIGIGGDSETAMLQWSRSYDSAGTRLTDALTGLGNWQGEQPLNGFPDSFELLLQFTTEIVPGTPFGFDSALRALTGSSGAIGSDSISDFGNAGRFTIILPQHYSITSQSGVFLVDQRSVPEPGTWMLLAAGLVGMVIVTRKGKLNLR